MNNSNDPYPKTLSFSAFDSDADAGIDEVFVLKKAVVLLLSKRSRQIASSPGMACWEAIASPIIEPSVVSRYKVDDFGRLRTLSKAEIIVHSVARWMVIAVVIGYGLAISLVVIHNSSALKSQEKVSQPHVAFQEEEP
jgi:hypothetical protein